MSEQYELRSAREIDADAERFIDAEDDEFVTGVTRSVDLPPEGSLADIVDQRLEVPADDEP